MLSITGSANDDVLIGIRAASRILGGAGDDRIHGQADDDVFYGQSGDDRLLGGAGGDRLEGGAGTDRAQYTDATAGVVADLQVVRLNTGIASGDPYVSIENLYGSTHDDNLRGDGAANVLWGHDGDDRLYGRDGNDVLSGMAGRDMLNGQGGDDRLFGAGADLFVFQNGAGRDTIADFDVSEAGERIDLRGVSAITDFADLTRHHLTQGTTGAVIDDGPGTTITLLGVGMSDLGAANFLL